MSYITNGFPGYDDVKKIVDEFAGTGIGNPYETLEELMSPNKKDLIDVLEEMGLGHMIVNGT